MLKTEEYAAAALEAVERFLHLLPKDVQRKVLLAKSVIETHGCATTEELRKELGRNWVITRRTKAIVAKYGDDVRCYSSSQFDEAEKRALESRIREHTDCA